MIPEIGVFALIIALFFAFMLVFVSLTVFYKKSQNFGTIISTYSFGQFFSILVAYVCLTICFLNNDFSLQYVAAHSSIDLPWFYKACAVWGGHEGSMLLWVLILSSWMSLVAIFCRSLDFLLYCRVLVVLTLLSIGFFLFLLITSNPFIRQFQIVEGQDLNPFLQDLGFLFHPPMLYMGYVGFAVSFAFAIAGLWLGKIDAIWIKWTRVWTLAAWSCLTLGITLGSWWAYRELGWGGWWFWDPVENASLMPWLVGTALIHSLAVMEKKQLFKPWTLLLAIIAFSLSLIGTFLVRSGILTSVHSFAVDPKRGLFILIFLAVVVGSSLLLFALRSNKLQANSQLSIGSRESILILNNIFLIVIMATILLGTVYPLIIDIFGLGKLSVGAPYFNTVLKPLIVPLLFLMGFGVHCKWNKDLFLNIFRKLWKILLLSALAAVTLMLLFAESFNIFAAIGLMLAFWIILSTWKAINKLKLSLLPMLFAHWGVALIAIGITISSSYELERDFNLSPGEKVEVAGYTITWLAENNLKGPNYHGIKATFAITAKDYYKQIYPEKRIYNVGSMAMTESAIDASIWRDIYIALGEPLNKKAWSVRIYYKPFVRWIWGGGFLIFLGAVCGLTSSLINSSFKKHGTKAVVNLQTL